MPPGVESKNAKSPPGEVAVLRRELQETQTRLQAAMKAAETAHNESSVGSWERDLVTDKVYWSDRLKQMLGITDPEFVTTADEVLSRVHPDNAEQWTRQFAAAIAAGSPINMEVRLRRKDRIYVWLHLLGRV